MSIQFGDILQHNNLVYPIVDIKDVKGGLRSIATFSDASLISEYTSGAGGTTIPEKYKTGYSLMLERNTGTIYYLSGISATNSSHWSPIGISGNGTGMPFTIPKWINSSTLGNSNITDNGDTITINGNLMVIGTTSTISTENLLVKDPIILLAGSQSGTPTYDAGLFVNRGSSETQAFIWDESMDEFKFITTTSGATVSGDVSIGTYSSVRTGVLSVGTGSKVNSRFLVSSSGGTVSLVVDEYGNVYNNGNGGVATNTAFGASALSKTAGYNNTAIGVNTLLSNTTGIRNTAIGSDSLKINWEGSFNTALGAFSLYSNTTSGYNVALGAFSLYSNTTAVANIGIGTNTLYKNVKGSYNTALGDSSLFYNTVGGANIAIGASSLYNNTTGVATFSTFNPGSGYTNDSYSGITLQWLSGSTFSTPPIVDIEVIGGTVSSVTLVSPGSGFIDTTTTFTAPLGPPGAGFQIGILSLLKNDGIVAIGHQSLYYNTTGSDNLSIGYKSLYFNTVGNSNLAIGYQSLYSNTTGTANLAIGYQSLMNNTYPEGNVGIGYQSLKSNVVGYRNTSLGYQSLYSNVFGGNNTAIGYTSLYSNSDGTDNTAIGNYSLYSNRSGISNVAVGVNALYYNTTGYQNTAIGNTSLNNNTSGGNNTAIGAYTLYNNTSTFYSLGSFAPGASYSPGTYSNVYLQFSSGVEAIGYPYVTIVVGPGGSVSSVVLESGGVGVDSSTYMKVDDNYDLGGTGHGFTINPGYIINGNYNTAIGVGSLSSNITGSYNIAIGNYSSSNNTIGYYNISIGSNSLNNSTTGWDSIAMGRNTLQYNTVGDRNTSLGYYSMRYYKGEWSTAVGGVALAGASTGIKTLTATFSPGSNYSPGTYSNVRLVYDSGTYWYAPNGDEPEYPSAEIVVGSGGTVSSVTLKRRGVLLTDTTTRFKVETGTQSYKLGTASGSGFSIGIATLDTAHFNTALGFGTLANMNVGSDNIAIGMWAGLNYGPTASNTNLLTGSDQSIFIGRFASPLYNNSVNEIVIGNEGRGNGNNTVTLGNDSVVKTYLKGSVQIGSNNTPSPTDSSAILKIDSTTKGVLLPKLTTSEINLISSPADGLIVYNTDLHLICYYNGNTAAWMKITGVATM
jgi:hypothetical protein